MVCLINTETLNVLSRGAAVNFSNYLINLIIHFPYHFMETLLQLRLFKERSWFSFNQPMNNGILAEASFLVD